MKQSTNYNMNKPDPNDMFSLEHWNQNTDKIDETLVPTFEDYTGETPVPTTDEALKNIKSKTKLSILMQNIKAFCKGCCTLGMLVDNCVTNNNNLPLAASQGKILMDQITSLNNNMEIETHNLVSLLNPDFYDSNSDKWLKIYRVGNIKVIDFGFKTKALTGKDKIATDIPENLRPITAFYGGVQARDTGEWAKATYFPAVLIVTGNNLELLTGTNASRSMYVSGTVCYV